VNGVSVNASTVLNRTWSSPNEHAWRLERNIRPLFGHCDAARIALV